MANLTFQDVKDLLVEQCDELTLLELLHLDTRDLVDQFEDRIEANFTKIVSQLDTSALDEIERTSN